MDPIEIARVMFDEAWNQQRFTNVRRLLADELPFHVGGDTRTTNADQLEAIVRAWHDAFPDFRFVVHSVTSDGHVVAVRATLHGTHEGPWGGLAPTGRTVAVEHAFFLRIEDGLVAEVWEILDRSSLQAQLVGDAGS